MAPVVFELWGFVLYTYTLLGALGFVVLAFTTMRRGALLGIPGRRSLQVVLAVAVTAVVGGRLAWFAAMPTEGVRDLLDLSSGGLLFFGAALGGGVGGLISMRIQRLPFFAMADVLALGLPVAHALFRVGCFLAGCCWGLPTDLPWAVHFDHPIGPAPVGVSLHPTQLYEAGLLLAVAVALRWLYRHRRWNGQVMGAYLLAYGVIRVVLEFVRGDTIALASPLTAGQVGGLGLVGLSLLVFGGLARLRSRAVARPIGYGSPSES